MKRGKSLFPCLVFVCLLFSLNGYSDVLIDVPNGGEIWYTDTTHNIVYSASGTIQSASLYYSTDAGTFWHFIAGPLSVSSGTNAYSWLIPSVTATTCLVRVFDASDRNSYDTSDNHFSIQPRLTNIVVTSLNDDGDGTLRQAIRDIATNGSITFAPSIQGMTIVLTSGAMIVSSSVDITGPIVIDGNNNSRIFTMAPSFGAAIYNVTFQNCNGGTSSRGGAIFCDNGSFITMKNCIFKNNRAGYGAGVSFRYSAFGSFVHCIFVGNQADMNSPEGAGGAVNACDNSVVMFHNCTVVDNYVVGRGGGIECDNSSHIYSYNSIVRDNSATGSGQDIFISATSSGSAYYSNLGQVYYEGSWSHQNGISVDPKFIKDWDGSSFDYRLQIDSLCLDAGNPDSAYNDFCNPYASFGKTNRNDVGAYGGSGNNLWPGYCIWTPGSGDRTLSLQPGAITAYRGQNIDIAVRISEATGVVGYRVALNLDPSKVTYVDGSATKVGTSTEIGWGPIVVSNTSPELALFTCASASGTILSGSASLMKFQLHVNGSLPDFTPISVTFNPLTSLNEDAIAYNAEIWSATVLGPNNRPSFTGGPYQYVMEDSGMHEVFGWATNIIAGPAYESWQSLHFALDVDQPQLFFTQPTLDATGTLRYTLSTDEFGVCNATAMLYDSGGTASGGIFWSTPYYFSFTVNPVNDAPSFIAGATAVVLNATGGQHAFPGWATAISAGPVNESTQTLWFNVETNHDNLFSATPSIDAGGTLRFTPAVGAHGVVKATATLYDNGGTANGGINYTSPAFFVMKIYIPFLWGDLNANGQAGAVDASLLLRYDAGLIDTFPGYPVAEYPEYYPDPTQPWNYFPLAADVNADSIAGTWDASLVLQKYVWLIQWFPADTSHDQWGPDAPLPPGKAVKRSAPRTMNAILEPLENAWSVTLQIDDAEDVQGLHAMLLYDPVQLQFNEEESGWLVESGLLAVNAAEPGRLVMAGALGRPLSEGPCDLLTVKFNVVGNGSDPLRIEIDEEQTTVNDGHIRIQLNYPDGN